MASQAISDTDILTEHFGFPPVSLIDDIINSVNILAERALNSVEKGLLEAPPAALGFRQPSSKSKTTSEQAQDTTPAEAAKNEIESGTHALETLLCSTIDKNFDKFEIHVLRNALCIQPVNLRNHIKLNHYKGLDFEKALEATSASSENVAAEGGSNDATEADEARLRNNPDVDSVMVLRRKLRESMRLNAMLAEEKAKNERMLGDLRRLLGIPATAEDQKVKTEPEGDNAAATTAPFAFLQNKADLTDSDASTPLTTTTAFTLSQLQSLRALSSSLRSMAPDLAPRSGGEQDADDDDGGRSSWRRERADYVEGATKRHLENVQGLELGKDGEIRDGEWQGEGRKLGRGEVEGLEAVVGSLGEESQADKMDES